MIEQWFALQVRRRFEFNCERLLQAKAYETFLPLDFVPGGSHTRKPLLPGYLFCRITERSVGLVVTTPGIVKILGAQGKPLPIDEEELQHLRAIEKSGVATCRWKFITAFSQVEILSGPLKGIIGTLVSDPRSRKLVVSVTLLQRSIAAELDESTAIRTLRSSNSSVSSEIRNLKDYLARRVPLSA